MGMETLVLLRHGESVKNVIAGKNHDRFYQNDEERWQVGVSEDRLVPITKNGWEQALKTGQALKEMFGVFDIIIHSGYRRTKATTKAVLKAYTPEEKERISVGESLMIRERDYGPCANLTQEEIQKFFPWFLDYRAKSEPFTMTPPSGESILQMCSGRLPWFLTRLAMRASGKVLVISHVNAIRGMRFLIEHWSYKKMNDVLKNEECLPCAATAYQFDAFGLGLPILQFENKILWQPR